MKRKNLRRALVVPCGLLFVLAFQNCTNGFSLSNLTSSSSSNTSDSEAYVSKYSVAVFSPSSSDHLSGTIQIKGKGPGFLNIEVLEGQTMLGRATPNASGSFTISLDTTQLSNGTHTVDVTGWDSAPGQEFSHTAKFTLSLQIQNGGGVTPPTTTLPPSAGGGGSVPDGGPGGYTNMVMNDSFGSSKAGANITSLNQFNPSASYGRSGSGWDDYMVAYGDGSHANLSMKSDHLELYPTNGGSGFIGSHFEYRPTGNERVYYEVRLATGRGAQKPQTWPAIWLFSGNEPDNNNRKSEFDIMETYMDQWDSGGSSGSGFPYHFAVTGHSYYQEGIDGKVIETPGFDVTKEYNTYGCEVYEGSNGNLQFNVYFNGKLVYQSTQGVPWGVDSKSSDRSSPPALFIGWNPGSTSWSPAVMKLDYVKAWVK